MREKAIRTILDYLSVFSLDKTAVSRAVIKSVKWAETEKAVYAVRILMAGIVFTVPVFEEAV